MAKTIKFNLLCDEKPIRNLDDLKENFVIEDILNYYNNKLLQKWLKVRGFEEEFEKVNKINEKEDEKIIYKLIEIFEIETNKDKIEESIEILKYKRENEIYLEEYKKLNFKKAEIIDDYYEGYDAIIESIIHSSGDMPKIKAAIKKIEEDYYYIFQNNFFSIYNLFFKECPMAIFAILMREKLRPFLLKAESHKDIKVSALEFDYTYKNSIEIIYKSLSTSMNSDTWIEESLKDYLKVYSGYTEQYWKDLETSEKEYMILKIVNGNFVRNFGKKDENYSATDINVQFKILKGIDYMSNNANHKLFYLEV